MTVRLRDVATLLEPDVAINTRTEAENPDWNKPPKRELPVPFKAEPVSSDEEALTAETVISRWKGTLPPAVKDPADPSSWIQLEDTVTPQWRIRWDGDVYLIEGELGRHKKGRCTRFLTVLMKRVS